MTKQTQFGASKRTTPKAYGPDTLTPPSERRIIERKYVLEPVRLRDNLYNNDGVLPGEDRELFSQLAEAVYGEFIPVGTVEASIVERILWTLWRLRRVPRIEAGRYVWRRYASVGEGTPGYDEKEFRARVETATAGDSARASGSARAEDRAAVARPMRSAADRIVEDGLFGHAWDTDTSELSRYEAQLDHRLKKLIEELNRYRR